MDDGDDSSVPEGGGGASPGSDLARQALESARASVGGQGRSRSAVRRAGPVTGRGGARRGWSGSGPDGRDPQPLGRLASRLAAERGWSDRIAGGLVFARWADLVGADIAEHAAPVALRDGELTITATTTAWATQLRLLQRQLLSRIAAGTGHGIVTRLRIHGPTAPSWRHGPLHVRGRGPRDTYG